MWDSLQAKQNWLQDQILKRDKALRKQEMIEHQISQAFERKELYLKELKKEQGDVDRLNRFSIMNLLLGLTGKIDEKREKELLELAAIEAKFREVEKIIIDLEKDKLQIQAELQKGEWQRLEEELAKLKEEKQQWMRENDFITANKIEENYEEKTALTAYSRGIREAISANKDALQALEEALNSLKDAHGYSSWDTFFGGGLLATALKHSELDASEEAIHRAQLSLQRFQTELMDLNDIEVDSIVIEKEGFLSFADYFFDDIFSAWTIHSEIDTAIKRVEDTMNRLEEIAKQLQVLLLENQQRLEKVEEEIHHLLKL